MFESPEWKRAYLSVGAKIISTAHLPSWAMGKGGVFLWGKAVGEKG
jgi:hypothetical protein